MMMFRRLLVEAQRRWQREARAWEVLGDHQPVFSDAWVEYRANGLMANEFALGLQDRIDELARPSDRGQGGWDG